MRVISIGRATSNDIIINDAQNRVSGLHAELIVNDDGSMFIRDKGSTNATFVNGNAIPASKDIAVSKSDVISFANVKSLDWARVESLVKMSGEIYRTYRIGRTEDNDIVINDTKNMVSGSHAKMELTNDGQLFLTDNSKNGTTVNGVSLSNQRRKVNRGDSIVFANTASLDWNKIETVKSKILKSPLKGEAKVFKLKGSKNLLSVAIVVLALFFSGSIFYFRCEIFGCNSIEGINKDYGTSVTWIHHEYYLTVNLKSEGKSDVKTVYWIGYNKNNPSQVVYVSHLDKERHGLNHLLLPFVSSGTGFIVSADGRIISNRHVLFPYTNYNNKTIEDYYRDPYVKEVVGRAFREAKRSFSDLVEIELSQESEFLGVAINGKQLNDRDDMYKGDALTFSDDFSADLGIMRIKPKELGNGAKLNFIDLDKQINMEDVNVGDKLVVIGFPYSKELNLRDDKFVKKMGATVLLGEVNSTPTKYQIQYSMNTAPGSSGSPVFDMNGALVAVNYAFFADAGNGSNHIANFGIKASLIPDLIRKVDDK